MENVKPGLYWAKNKKEGNHWQVVEVEECGNSLLIFGWEQSVRIDNYTDFIPLSTPDGSDYVCRSPV